MSGEVELTTMLRTLEPELRPGTYVFVTVSEVPDRVDAVAIVREDEGWTLVLDQGAAEASGFGYDFIAAMITLRVHSALSAIGPSQFLLRAG